MLKKSCSKKLAQDVSWYDDCGCSLGGLKTVMRENDANGSFDCRLNSSRYCTTANIVKLKNLVLIFLLTVIRPSRLHLLLAHILSKRTIELLKTIETIELLKNYSFYLHLYKDISIFNCELRHCNNTQLAFWLHCCSQRIIDYLSCNL